MKKSYDIIVVGAGLSSLMFLSKYVKKFPDNKVLLVEKETRKKSQTFGVWQGPNIINIEKEYKITPKKTWRNLGLSYKKQSINKVMEPYSYVVFDGDKTLRALLKGCKKNITYIEDCEVEKKVKHEECFLITKKNIVYSSKILIDSRNDMNSFNSSELLYQAFVGSEIKITTNKFDSSTVTLMDFKENKNAIQFTYILPLTKKRALIETTFFTKKPNLYQIKKIHKKYLKRFEKPILIKQEEGILPMGVAKPKNYKNILKIGMSAGMIRPSSGYSMMRVAGWISKVGDLELNEQTISRFIYNPSRVLNWMDKLFLKVCFNRPDMGPTLFMSLFSKAETGAVIRFMAESNTYLDLLKVVMSLPKKIMIMSLFK